MALDLPAVLRFANDLQRVASLPDLFAAVHEAVARATAYRAAWISVVEPGPPRVVHLLGGGGPGVAHHLAAAPRVPVDGDRFLEEAAAATGPVVIEDARRDPRTNGPLIARLGLRSLVTFPMRFGEEVTGGLVCGAFDPDPPHAPAPAELELLAVYAALVAAAYHRLTVAEAARVVEADLAAARRRESVGLLAGGVAHDFNNLLTAILNGLAFIREGSLSTVQREDLEAVTDAARRAADLTRQLLALGRRQTLRRAPQDLARRIRDLAQLLRRLIPEHVTIVVDMPERLPPVLGDGPQLDQVLMNLCLNARDAMPGGGRLRIAARPVTVAPGPPARPGAPPPGPHVLVSVSDTGTGIPPELLDRVLEPFFTTKEPGEGTGLGLAVAAGIVEQHGGAIACESQPGEGTRFDVWLPVGGEAAEAEAGEGPAGPAFGAGERVLLADDDERVRTAMERTLGAAGYRVRAVEEGAAAIRAAEAEPFDLVILDAVMPGVGGREAWERIAAVRPGARFLVVSGHAADSFPLEAMERAGLPVLAKPFTGEALLAAVRAALGGATPAGA